MLKRLELPQVGASPLPLLIRSPAEALGMINSEPTAPLLILTGAGTSVAYGINSGYGPPYDEQTPVNEKYWRVFEQAIEAQKNKKLASSFYDHLCAFVKAQTAQRSVCVATSNIDGLCPPDLDTGESGILIELHGAVSRSQCSSLSTAACKRRLHASIAAAPAAAVAKPNEVEKFSLGNCPACSAPLRFNVCGFNDYPADVLGTSDAQQRLRFWVEEHISSPRFFVVCIGCSDHVHSMVHEARAVSYTRSQLATGSLTTDIVCVNPDPAVAKAVGPECIFVSCSSEDFFV